MKVSVIVPAYNASDYIRRCLDSIVNQVYKNIEIIVIDDSSSDSTKQIIKEYSQKDNRIIPFYSTMNKGVSASRNIGLRACSGDYVMFVDSDDEITKDAIRRMVDIANKYNSDFVDNFHLLKYTNSKGKEFSFTESKVPKKNLVLGSINDNPKIITMNTYVTGKLIKKSLLEDLEFDEDLRRYEDLIFDHKLKTRIKNYVMMNKTVYVYYQRENSLVNTFGTKHLAFLDAINEVKNIYNEYDKNVNDEFNALLFQNMVLTLFTKVIKNDMSDEENLKIVIDTINELIKIFPDYNDNEKLNKFIKNFINKYKDNEVKLKKIIKKVRKINFIKLYFKYLSIVNKYEIKNPLL